MTAVTSTGAAVSGGAAARINTKTARRRMVAYSSLADFEKDLERVEAAHRAGTLRRLGNREVGAILGHLAVSIRGSIDGADELKKTVPWWIRLVGPLVKNRILSAPIRPGVKLTREAEAALWRDATSFEEGFGELRKQLERLARGEKPRTAHPVFGMMTEEEWGRFHLRHSEMHMSFLQV